MVFGWFPWFFKGHAQHNPSHPVTPERMTIQSHGPFEIQKGRKFFGCERSGVSVWSVSAISKLQKGELGSRGGPDAGSGRGEN